MKIKLIFTLLLCSTYSFAHLKPDPIVYHVQYKAGSNYNSDRPYEKQKFIGEHIQFVKKMYHNGHLLWGGFFKGNKFISFFIKAKSEAEVRKKLKNDLSLKAKITTVEISPFTLTMIKKKTSLHHGHKH